MLPNTIASIMQMHQNNASCSAHYCLSFIERRFPSRMCSYNAMIDICVKFSIYDFQFRSIVLWIMADSSDEYSSASDSSCYDPESSGKDCCWVDISGRDICIVMVVPVFYRSLLIKLTFATLCVMGVACCFLFVCFTKVMTYSNRSPYHATSVWLSFKHVYFRFNDENQGIENASIFIWNVAPKHHGIVKWYRVIFVHDKFSHKLGVSLLYIIS